MNAWAMQIDGLMRIALRRERVAHIKNPVVKSQAEQGEEFRDHLVTILPVGEGVTTRHLAAATDKSVYAITHHLQLLVARGDARMLPTRPQTWVRTQ